MGLTSFLKGKSNGYLREQGKTALGKKKGPVLRGACCSCVVVMGPMGKSTFAYALSEAETSKSWGAILPLGPDCVTVVQRGPGPGAKMKRAQLVDVQTETKFFSLSLLSAGCETNFNLLFLALTSSVNHTLLHLLIHTTVVAAFWLSCVKGDISQWRKKKKKVIGNKMHKRANICERRETDTPTGRKHHEDLYLFCICIINWDVFNYFECWNKAC